MARIPGLPPMGGLKKRIADARDADKAVRGSFVRQTFCLSREDARAKAREWFATYPKAAYWTEVESWRQLDGDRIEFTMRRLPSAD